MRGLYQLYNGLRSLLPKKVIHCSTLGFIGRITMTSFQNTEPPNIEEQLNSFGYKFMDGELRDIQSKERFEFNAFENHRDNQRRYEELGEVIEKYVYHLLETEGELKRFHIPVDSSEDESHGFIFHSNNAFDCDRLMLIVHGSGVVRAGQWSRRLVINHSLESGTQLPYIKKAKEMGYGVLVLNSNQHYDEITGKKIQVSSSPEKHFNYVWKELVEKKCKAKDVAIVAHSYGGHITVDGAIHNPNMLKKTFAVALTDSVHFSSCNQKKFTKWMSRNVCNWVSSDKELDTKLRSRDGDCLRVSAGTPIHEETSWKAFDSVWKFFDQRWEKRKLQSDKEKVGKKTKNERKDAEIIDGDVQVKTDDSKKEESKEGGEREKDVEENMSQNQGVDGSDDIKKNITETRDAEEMSQDESDRIGDGKRNTAATKDDGEAMSQEEGGDKNDIVDIDKEEGNGDDEAMSQDEGEITEQSSSNNNDGQSSDNNDDGSIKIDSKFVDEEMNSQDVSDGEKHGGEL